MLLLLLASIQCWPCINVKHVSCILVRLSHQYWTVSQMNDLNGLLSVTVIEVFHMLRSRIFFSSNKTVRLLVCYFYSMFNETEVCTYSYLGCNMSCDHQNAELDSKFTQFLVTGIHRNVSNKTRKTTANQYLYQYSFMLVKLGRKRLLKQNAWKVIKDFFVVRKTKQSHLVSIRIPVCKCSG